MSETQSAKIARSLLQIQAVKISPENPFTWASGLKSPLYCDNRLTLSYPEIRNLICDGFVNLIREIFPQTGGISGVATAGIPHGMLVADRLNLPFLYVRSKPKEHGLGNQIEGKLDPTVSYLMVEDLISTGKSSLEAVKAMKNAGGNVSGLVSVFSYGLPEASGAFERAGIPWKSLVSYGDMLAEALKSNYISQKHLGSLQEWRKNPKAWSEENKGKG